MRRVLYAISSRLPCRIIADGNKPYLERYYLATMFGVRFYLHRFVASDPDRGLHDHPWPWAFSVILAGWYWEVTRGNCARVRWFNFLIGDSFHRVVLPLDRGVDNVWTLFAHRAKRSKPWGFLRDKGQLGTIYVEHRRSPEDAWWKSAPRGRHEPRRMPR
ncbi:hypothetical protein [Burkholderia glumae]|uniref:hypothetical protein n=1 Tax=Burkholderia glumae TaxID=337 RepID=UPI001296D675|nr:hypothetical protein [Burkholderia glumae]MCM2547615.1 hypothetical protein [Burkholderia glumae]QGA37982.1 hypothetical protein GAS19_10325 [Burkholderia glumae]